MYQGGHQVYTDRQTGDWGAFFRSGQQGVLHYDPGQGKPLPSLSHRDARSWRHHRAALVLRGATAVSPVTRS